jgi:two-component system OmpR family sensor kinase
VSLRARLLIALVALAAVGLLVTGTITTASLRSFLVKRVDQQLQAAQPLVIQQLNSGGDRRVDGSQFAPRRPDRANVQLPPGTYGDVRSASGVTLSTVSVLFGGADAPAPKLPATAVADVLRSGKPDTITVGSVTGTVRYRALLQPVPIIQPSLSGQVATSTQGVLLVAVPMRDVDQTVRRLLLVEVLVAGTVLLLLAGVAFWVVRLGLRPLENIADTAGAIAAGDLSRRVESTSTKTEVGRLSGALNEMLAQIEGAFAERAESENRLRRFLADASHELRTPLTSIRGYAELFRRGADRRPDDLAKAMRRIEEEAGRMGLMVEDLLLLARLDEGRPFERVPVDLTMVARDAVDDARARDPERPVTLEAWDGVVVPGDEARLRQVAQNLVANALEHTPAGTPVVVRVGGDAGEAVFEVIDRGPGLSAEEAAHVFDRFYRADPSRTRASGGAGLGLAIVAAIVAAHGGTASVDSRPGAGATFRVRLPLLTAAPDLGPIDAVAVDAIDAPHAGSEQQPAT